MIKILMTGGSGLLGKAIKQLEPNIISPTHQELDITKPNSIEKAIKKYRPEIILHLAAANKPPEHETNPELGLKVNIIGTANLCLSAQKFVLAKWITESPLVRYSAKSIFKRSASMN